LGSAEDYNRDIKIKALKYRYFEKAAPEASSNPLVDPG
jgi:hypothetical protein